MVYGVRVDNIAISVDAEVQKAILDFLKTYDFPYVTCIIDKTALRGVFTDYFNNRRSNDSLKSAVYYLAKREGRSLRGVAACAWCEPNRLHTMGLGSVLLSKGEKKCCTVHSYGYTSPMSPVCRNNLEGKQLNIEQVIKNSFPKTSSELSRVDIPMIPQHVNCRHVMAPIR